MDQIENNINGGQIQILPTATHAVQNNYYGMPSQIPHSDLTTQSITTVFVLGAGVDSVLGLPTSASLIPKIIDYLQTEEGQQVDACLRKAICGVRFHFDKFVSTAIDRLAKDLDREIDTICHNVNEELTTNTSITETQRKLGNLVVRLFSKVRDIKNGAAFDSEIEQLIEEVLGTPVKDEAIIDFSSMNYTETFKTIIVDILQKSIRDSSSPILRHVYKNILDIEQLLAQYFYGFYSGMPSYIRTYLYISWTLWAFLVHEEQTYRDSLPDPNAITSSIYDQLRAEDASIISFNYTSFAREANENALYFHGDLTHYVDIENKNEFTIDDIANLDILDFIKNRLADEISFDSDRKAIPIPTFMPPLKLKPVISRQYIATWYESDQVLCHANHIVILGYSFTNTDDYFCEMLRDNRNAKIIIVDKDIDTITRNACRVFQLPYNRYSKQTVDGVEHRKYDNRIEVVGEDLTSIDLSKYL